MARLISLFLLLSCLVNPLHTQANEVSDVQQCLKSFSKQVIDPEGLRFIDAEKISSGKIADLHYQAGRERDAVERTIAEICYTDLNKLYPCDAMCVHNQRLNCIDVKYKNKQYLAKQVKLVKDTAMFKDASDLVAYTMRTKLTFPTETMYFFHVCAISNSRVWLHETNRIYK